MMKLGCCLWFTLLCSVLVSSACGGTGYNDGEPGSIVFITIPPPVGTMILLR